MIGLITRLVLLPFSIHYSVTSQNQTCKLLLSLYLLPIGGIWNVPDSMCTLDRVSKGGKRKFFFSPQICWFTSILYTLVQNNLDKENTCHTWRHMKH